MSERKVLNKYYPPDFDPAKIPRAKCEKNRQYTVRMMAPFNMRCQTCGEYIYKAKKFNARKEDVENDTYLGVRIYRFYIKCPRCLQEIAFKTDPQTADYVIEAGATRNFMALKLAEEQAFEEERLLREQEANNPMKLLENRTEQSKNEIERLENLEMLKDLNKRLVNVDYDSILTKYSHKMTEDQLRQLDLDYIKTLKLEKKEGSEKTTGIGEETLPRSQEQLQRLSNKDEKSAPLVATMQSIVVRKKPKPGLSLIAQYSSSDNDSDHDCS